MVASSPRMTPARADARGLAACPVPTRRPGLLALAAALQLLGCGDAGTSSVPGSPVTLVFKHGKFFGDPTAFDALVRRFEESHPGVRVRTEALPSSSDEQHQFYVINLRARGADFDVLALDIIWVAAFARAGWIADLSHLLPLAEHAEFFDGPLSAVRYENRIYAIPWFIDAGLLYYRTDLLARYGFSPPETWGDLAHMARTITRGEPNLHGFVWQGKQYEGLVCNALEYVWSAGGDVLREGRVVLDSPESRRALSYMRGLLDDGISPELVMTATEEPSRLIFGSGRAVFLRNWPYAWSLFERADSPVRGRVGISGLPHFPGHAAAATLGGWQLGVNRHTRHPHEAAAFVRFMTSAASLKALARDYGLNPARRSLYDDPELLAAQPHLQELRGIFEHARPRPITPRYLRISQVLQSEFSAVVAGIRQPAEALLAAQREIHGILGEP
jgi:multiple sugar transport system substrate-binding protein